jgi:Cdc6-like AAA superfamily ATPase
LNDYKSVILELLNGGYQVDDDFDENEIEMIPENRIIERTPRTYKEHPLNLIIYGAPGTGKTYSTTEQAVARIENRSVR